MTLGPVDITQLPVNDLSKLRQSLASDVELITGSYGNLKVAQARFNQAKQACNELQSNDIDPKANSSESDSIVDVMVPLTGSLYVPGKLNRNDKLLCDIGTGYFIEKSSDDAAAFCQSKLQMIESNLTKVGQSLQIKRRDLEMVTMVLQNKMSQIKAQQQQAIEKADQLIS